MLMLLSVQVYASAAAPVFAADQWEDEKREALELAKDVVHKAKHVTAQHQVWKILSS